VNRDAIIYVKDIEEAIGDIEFHIGNRSRQDFLEDKTVQDAVILRILVIGEAVKNLPKDFTKKHSEVSWSEIARMRDKLIHGYFEIDLNTAYAVFEDDLPILKKQISKIIREYE
jgi:uncharacterized protein with HEPN domain